MGSCYEVEVTITSARDLKNVNWRHGKLSPYAVVCLDQQKKYSTSADDVGDTSPYWDYKLLIPLSAPIEDSTLGIEILHANAADDTKPLVGSTKLPLRDIIDDIGLESIADLKLELKRPSGRPQGKLDIKLSVCEPHDHAPNPHYPTPYVAPSPASPYGSRYTAPPACGAPPSGYPRQDAAASYGQASYEQPQGGYYDHQPGYVGEEKKKSVFGGMGTGLAVGAVAGALGGLALAEGFDVVENKIADDAVGQVEVDLGYDGDD